MNKLVDWLATIATVGASFGVAFLYACNVSIPAAHADTHVSVPMSMCDEVEEVLCEAVESGMMTKLEADRIVQSCRDSYE